MCLKHSVNMREYFDISVLQISVVDCSCSSVGGSLTKAFHACHVMEIKTFIL